MLVVELNREADAWAILLQRVDCAFEIREARVLREIQFDQYLGGLSLFAIFLVLDEFINAFRAEEKWVELVLRRSAIDLAFESEIDRFEKS